MLAARLCVPFHSTFRWSRPVLAGLGLVAIGACADHKRSANADSDLTRDLQLAGQVNAQPTFQDTALSSAAPLRAPAPPKTPAPTPTRTARQERRMSPPPAQDVRPSIPTPNPVPAAAPTAMPSREIGAGAGIVMTTGGRVCGDQSAGRQDRGDDRFTGERNEWRPDPGWIEGRARGRVRDTRGSGAHRFPRPRSVRQRLTLPSDRDGFPHDATRACEDREP